jgi:hypothetical protein
MQGVATPENTHLLRASVNRQHLLRLLTPADGLKTQPQRDRQPLRGEISEQKSFSCTRSYPRGHFGCPEKVKVGNASLLTYFSADSEYTSRSLSEPRGRLLRAFVRGSGPGVSRSESLRIALRRSFFCFSLATRSVNRKHLIPPRLAPATCLSSAEGSWLSLVYPFASTSLSLGATTQEHFRRCCALLNG